jgi:hypothetical protein
MQMLRMEASTVGMLHLPRYRFIGTRGTRFWDYFVTKEMTKRIQGNGAQIPESMRLSKLWKTIEGTVCLFYVPVVLPAIYRCSGEVKVMNIDPKEVSMSGICWSLLNYGAVAEWTMSVSWAFYMLSTGWDVFHLWEWNATLRAVSSN